MSDYGRKIRSIAKLLDILHFVGVRCVTATVPNDEHIDDFIMRVT